MKGSGRIGLEEVTEEVEQPEELKQEAPAIDLPAAETKDSEPEAEIKTEDSILFPELDIEGYTIRPWTLGKLRRINPHLENIFKSLEDKDIQLTIDNVGSHLKEIYFAAIPEIVAILAISLEKSEDDLEDVTIPQAIKLIYAVFKQNEESIKNVSSLLQLANVDQMEPQM